MALNFMPESGSIRKVLVFTGTRAEYGLLYWLMKDIEVDSELELQLLVSGSHLSPEFGLTYQKIEEDGFRINEKVEILMSSDSAIGVAKSLALAVLGFAEALDRLSSDVVVLLGDRYEALAVSQAAILMRTPVLHIHGGEITEGAYDDSIRHAITKLSLLHAVSTDEYRQRVVQLGESPGRVKNVGAVGLDHLRRGHFLSLEELGQSLSFDLNAPFFLVTYHPVTLAKEDPLVSFRLLLESLNEFTDYKVILTYPNADDGGRKIISLIEQYAESSGGRVLAIPSLGQLRYLSAVKHCSAVIGNSSSGLIEVPSFFVPTVNIGERQKGRIAAESVIHCGTSKEDITQAIYKALADLNSGRLGSMVNPYGNGCASSKIIQILKTSDLTLTKRFYDIPFQLLEESGEV